MTIRHIPFLLLLLSAVAHNNVTAMETGNKYKLPYFSQQDGTKRYFYPSKNNPTYKSNPKRYKAAFKSALSLNVAEYQKAGKSDDFLQKYETFQLNLLQKN